MEPAQTQEVAIHLLFDKRNDGRYYVHSPSVPGLHLAGPDLVALRRDVEPAVRDLLFYNRNIRAGEIRWVPSLDEVVTQLDPEAEYEQQATYVITLAGAA